MAIIPIKDIPQPRNLAPTQRDFIRADIREAIKLGVSKFEFDGEYYKYNTLKNNAKEAFKSLFINEIYNPGVAKAEKRLKKNSLLKPLLCPHTKNISIKRQHFRQ